jgi:catechol 2,3-dioxygenase-like lactoylglutathione lyase family enzyme
MVEKISAVTLRVATMEASVRFYKEVLGLEIIYGGEGSYFTSLRTKDGGTILNLEHGNADTLPLSEVTCHFGTRSLLLAPFSPGASCRWVPRSKIS